MTDPNVPHYSRPTPLPRVNLADAIWNAIPVGSRSTALTLRFGVVKTVSPFTVTVSEVDIEANRLIAYTPVVDDVVALLFSPPSQWVALGKIVSS